MNRVLNNPPVKDAVLEVRFNPNKSITLSNLDKFAASLKSKFPINTPVISSKFEFKIDPAKDASSQINSNKEGVRLSNSSSNRIVSAELNKIVISNLPPYHSWDLFRTDASEILDEYLKFAPQTDITRLGMRFINLLNFPRDEFVFEEYIKTFHSPNLDDEIPQSLTSLDVTTGMYFKDIDCHSRTRQAFMMKDKNVQFTLDIDVFQDKEHALENTDIIWELFDQMRVKRNALFFSTLTDKALTLYE